MFAHFLNWYRRLPKTRKRHSNWDKLTQTCYSTWKVTVVERMDNPSRTHVSWHGTTALHWGCLSNDPEACKATFAKACPRKQHDINTWSWLQDVLYVSPSSPQRFSLSLSLGRISTRKRGYAKNRLCLCKTTLILLSSNPSNYETSLSYLTASLPMENTSSLDFLFFMSTFVHKTYSGNSWRREMFLEMNIGMYMRIQRIHRQELQDVFVRMESSWGRIKAIDHKRNILRANSAFIFSVFGWFIFSTHEHPNVYQDPLWLFFQTKNVGGSFLLSTQLLLLTTRNS